MRKLCDDAYARAENCSSQHRDKLETIARALLEFETLDGAQIRDIIKHGRMMNPPTGPIAPRKDPPPLPRTAAPPWRPITRTA